MLEYYIICKDLKLLLLLKVKCAKNNDHVLLEKKLFLQIYDVKLFLSMFNW